MTLLHRIAWFTTKTLAKHPLGRKLLWFATKIAVWEKVEYLIHRVGFLAGELMALASLRKAVFQRYADGSAPAVAY